MAEKKRGQGKSEGEISDNFPHFLSNTASDFLIDLWGQESLINWRWSWLWVGGVTVTWGTISDWPRDSVRASKGEPGYLHHLWPTILCWTSNFIKTPLYSPPTEKAMAPHSSTLAWKILHGWRSLVGCRPWGLKESDTTEQLHFHFSLSRIGEGNGNPLQCSYLENPRDGGAWWAAVYGVTQSWTQLKWFSSSSSIVLQNGPPLCLCLVTPWKTAGFRNPSIQLFR